MSYKIIVPSRERARWLMSRKYTTLDFVRELDPTLMVRDDDSQLEDYRSYARGHGVKLVVFKSRNVRNVAQTYDYIINRAVALGMERLIILDDDLTFRMHNPTLGVSPFFKLTTPRELSTLLTHTMGLVSEQMPLLTCPPAFSRSQPRLLSFCKSLQMAHVYYLPHFAEHPEHRFWTSDDVEAYCDFNLALRLLTGGYLMGWMNTIVLTHVPGNVGGCATYRDLDHQLSAVDYLVRTYPDFVSTHEKRGWAGDDQVVRYSPRVAWKHAFDHATFERRFSCRAVDFANELVARYEKIYSTFIEELRHEA